MRASTVALAHTLCGLNYVNNTFVEFAREACFEVTDQATNQIVGYAPQSDEKATCEAVDVAALAQTRWQKVMPLERSRLLLKAADALEKNQEELARLISLETGRPIRTETRPEVANAVRIFRYFAGLPMEVKGETIQFSDSILSTTIREPLGVVGAIVPWNVPAMLFCLKVGAALAAGNSVVVKPAEQAPISSLFLAKTLAGVLPEGILNVVNGFGEQAGTFLARNEKISKLTFTGSVEVGRAVYKLSAERLIPVTLELGGKSPMIIFPDADLKKAIRLADVGMRFSRQGQSCTSTTRLYVHESIATPFIEGLSEHLKAQKIGDPFDEMTDIGSLVSREQMMRVEGYIARAAALEGLQIRQIGVLPEEMPFKFGCFLPPTLVINPEPNNPIVQEEIFGPVLAVRLWSDFDAVIDEANDSDYGLSAALITQNLSSALSAARRIKAGFVQINSGLVIQPGLAFGGYKNSGVGREASLESMLEAFTQVKTIIIDHSV